MLGLLDLVRIGARAVSRYTGMVLALWVTQALVTGAAIVGIAQTLAAALADRPLLDAAVDGDLVALLELMSALPELLWASIWTIVAIVLLWVVASWFLAGGVIAVLGERGSRGGDAEGEGEEENRESLECLHGSSSSSSALDGRRERTTRIDDARAPRAGECSWQRGSQAEQDASARRSCST